MTRVRTSPSIAAPFLSANGHRSICSCVSRCCQLHVSLFFFRPARVDFDDHQLQLMAPVSDAHLRQGAGWCPLPSEPAMDPVFGGGPGRLLSAASFTRPINRIWARDSRLQQLNWRATTRWPPQSVAVRNDCCQKDLSRRSSGRSTVAGWLPHAGRKEGTMRFWSIRVFFWLVGWAA